MYVHVCVHVSVCMDVRVTRSPSRASQDNNCFELPPRERRFGLVASNPAELEHWRNWLVTRDWSVVPEWCFVADDALFDAARALQAYEPADGDDTAPIRACFLCEPCPLLATSISDIESRLQASAASGPLTACDVGA
jgi:hypothetical protein